MSDVAPLIDLIIPAAGRGTRVAALRGSTSKELLEVNGVPLLQRDLMAGRAAGLERAWVVLSPDKEDIRHWVTSNPVEGLDIRTVEQPEPVGCVDALHRAHIACGRRPALVLFPDHLPRHLGAAAASLVEAWKEVPVDSTGLTWIRPEDAGNYGRFCAIEGTEGSVGRWHLEQLVPPNGPHPSPPIGGGWMAALGGVYTDAYFSEWRARCAGGGGDEHDLGTKNALAARGGLLGVALKGRLFDLGHPPGVYAARAAFAPQPLEDRR